MNLKLSPCLPKFASSLLLAVLLLTLFLPLPATANEPENHHHSKVVGGYFEEWSIYFAGYNIANLQSNGVADKLTHLTYAFGNATSTGCASRAEVSGDRV